MRLERSDANDRTYAAKHILRALFRFQKIANHRFHWLQTGSFSKVSASFKRGRAFGLFIALGQHARNGRLPGRLEAFLRGIRRPELTKKQSYHVLGPIPPN
jgi:hypothetical protein